MKSSFLFFVYASAIFIIFGCQTEKEKKTGPFPKPFTVTQSAPNQRIDIIFVVDTSMSMVDNQARLREHFPELMRQLQQVAGGLPGIHLGVITPDLGSAPIDIPGCGASQEGIFQKGVDNGCANPVGQRYLVDVEPGGCAIDKVLVEGATTCPHHDCSQTHCEPEAFPDGNGGFLEPAGLMFVLDDNGCPRCRNYTGETLESVFSCMADVGVDGCGFEQPLEALYKALESTSAHNLGFLRPDAALAVVFVTDEDDCSVENTDIFTPEGGISDPLGSLHSFRCTEFGIICSEPWDRFFEGYSKDYSECRSRTEDDPDRLLFPLGRYSTKLLSLKEAHRIVITSIAGPVGTQLTTVLNTNQIPVLAPSCQDSEGGADPAIRLHEFVDMFLPFAGDAQWAKTSICSPDYSQPMAGLGQRLGVVISTNCINGVLAGCPDPAFASGHDALTSLPSEVAGTCAPVCTVHLVGPGQNRLEVPSCPADHASGHPDLVDPDLPVEWCWHITYTENCAVPCPAGMQDCDPQVNPVYFPSRGAGLVVSGRTGLAAGVRVESTCEVFELTETSCQDGLDNDADGLVDGDDPDCAT